MSLQTCIPFTFPEAESVCTFAGQEVEDIYCTPMLSTLYTEINKGDCLHQHLGIPTNEVIANSDPFSYCSIEHTTKFCIIW